MDELNIYMEDMESRSGNLTVEVRNMLNQTLVSQSVDLPADIHAINLKQHDLISGTYFVTISNHNRIMKIGKLIYLVD